MEEDGLYTFHADEQAIVLSMGDNVRLLLRRPDLTPVQVVQAGKFLFGLARLPRVTSGFSMSLSLESRSGLETRFHAVQLDDDSFQLSSGGSTEALNGGSDTFLTIHLEVGVGWRDADETNWPAVTGWLEAFKELAADDSWQVSIDDDGDGADFDMRETPDEPDYWQHLLDADDEGEDEDEDEDEDE